MATRQSTSRETKAQALIESGAVTLHLGRGYAHVAGSGGKVYQVSANGCTCPAFAKRGPGCKHELAVRELCRLFREHRSEARTTGRTRMPAVLARALANATPAPVTTCRDCGRPARSGLCADCFIGVAP